MAKCLNLLHYILNEYIRSNIHQAYEALKSESRKGDFYSLIQKDLKDLNRTLDEASLKNHSKTQWKAYIKYVVKESAFQLLAQENPKLENTKDIHFE